MPPLGGIHEIYGLPVTTQHTSPGRRCEIPDCDEFTNRYFEVKSPLLVDNFRFWACTSHAHQTLFADLCRAFCAVEQKQAERILTMYLPGWIEKHVVINQDEITIKRVV